MSKLEYLMKKRDNTIGKLWIILNSISYIQGTSMTDEDLNLWTKVTHHSAIQNALKRKEKETNE